MHLLLELEELELLYKLIKENIGSDDTFYKVDKTKPEVVNLIDRLKYKGLVELEDGSLAYTLKLLGTIDIEMLEIESEYFKAFKINEYIKEYIYKKNIEGLYNDFIKDDKGIIEHFVTPILENYDVLSSSEKDIFKNINKNNYSYEANGYTTRDIFTKVINLLDK